ATAQIEPNGVPSAGWFIVQNNGVAQGIVEGALTIGLGEAGEGGAAVGGDRCAGDVDGTGPAASGVVVADNDLAGVIWVTRTECLRLGNVGRGLSAGDQVHVRCAIRQGRQQFFDSPGQRQFLDELGEGAGNGSSPSLRLAAGDHDGSGPEVLLLIDAQLLNFRTVKSVRDQRVFGVGDDLIVLLRLCHARSERRERAKTCQRQKDAGQDYEYAN